MWKKTLMCTSMKQALIFVSWGPYEIVSEWLGGLTQLPVDKHSNLPIVPGAVAIWQGYCGRYHPKLRREFQKISVCC
jgi:hypothetical protein